MNNQPHLSENTMSAILAPSFDPEDPALRRVEGGFPVFSAVLEGELDAPISSA